LPSQLEMEMVRAAQRAEREALTWIYDTYRRRIYNLCYRMIHDGADAEDLMHDVFVQVFRRIETFRGDSAFATWLHRLAVNIVLMEIRSRKSKRYQLCPLELKKEDDEDTYEQYGFEDGRLRASLDRVVLEAALQELPPGYRLVFLLHDVHGYEHQEIAEILSCSVGNCKSQLHKARVKLRKIIETAPANRVSPPRSNPLDYDRVAA
jgi:RNA polymerase sigma-70 factor, ECF subfamily